MLTFSNPQEIKDLMEQLGYGGHGRQKDFARLVGVTPGTMNRILKGVHKPSAATLQKLIELAGEEIGKIDVDEAIDKTLKDKAGRRYLIEQAKLWLREIKRRD